MRMRRREFLRAGLAAFGTLSLPALFRLRAESARPTAQERTAVIVIWLRGGVCASMYWLMPEPATSR